MSVGGLVNEIAVIASLLNGVLLALVPAASGNVYVPAPELPLGVYEGTYPYISLVNIHYGVTPIEAANILRTDESDPNVYTVDLVDQLVSESGSTLAATEAFQMAFNDALNVLLNRRTARYLIDGNGVGQATTCYPGAADRNPLGTDQLRAGAAVTVRRYLIHTLSLPISPSNT